MIKLSNEAKILFRDEIAPLLKQDKIKECTDLLLKMGTSTSREVLAGLCEMGYAFVGYKAVPGFVLMQTPITKVVIPEGVEEIGEWAFNKCENLTSVQLPNSLRGIGTGAFYGTSFTQVEIPNSVEEIKEGAFAWCENLKTVQLPSSIRSIKYAAFSYCPDNIVFYIPEDFHWESVMKARTKAVWYKEHSKVR